MATLGVAPDDDDGKAASEATANQEPPARRRAEPPAEKDTPAKALFRRVKDCASNADIASSLRALSETKNKGLTAREFDSDRPWAQEVSELLDALTEPEAA